GQEADSSIAAGSEAGLESTLKVETRVQIPLGLPTNVGGSGGPSRSRTLGPLHLWANGNDVRDRSHEAKEDLYDYPDHLALARRPSCVIWPDGGIDDAPDRERHQQQDDEQLRCTDGLEHADHWTSHHVFARRKCGKQGAPVWPT